MRDIKFRVWDDGKMEYDICVGRHSKDHEDCKINTVVIIDDGDCWFPHEPYHNIMQYTGLKDKNGKEIYEEDILKQYPGFGCEWLPRTGIVKYLYASFWFELGTQRVILDDHDCSFIVLGNIYENPELIKELDMRRDLKLRRGGNERVQK